MPRSANKVHWLSKPANMTQWLLAALAHAGSWPLIASSTPSKENETGQSRGLKAAARARGLRIALAPFENGPGLSCLTQQ